MKESGFSSTKSAEKVAIIEDRCFSGSMEQYLPNLLLGVEGIHDFYRVSEPQPVSTWAELPILRIEGVEVIDLSGESIVKYGSAVLPEDVITTKDFTLKLVQRIELTYTWLSKRRVVQIPVLIEDRWPPELLYSDCDDPLVLAKPSIFWVNGSPSIEDVQGLLDVFDQWIFDSEEVIEVEAEVYGMSREEFERVRAAGIGRIYRKRRLRALTGELLAKTFCGPETGVEISFLERTRNMEVDVPRGYELRVSYRGGSEPKAIDLVADGCAEQVTKEL